jgi:hypothetical protein
LRTTERAYFLIIVVLHKQDACLALFVGSTQPSSQHATATHHNKRPIAYRQVIADKANVHGGLIVVKAQVNCDSRIVSLVEIVALIFDIEETLFMFACMIHFFVLTTGLLSASA